MNKIKKIRTEKKLTQKQLGKKCGIDEANIRKYENGKLNPKITTYRKIASALGVNISDLIEDWGVFSIEELKSDLENDSTPFDEVSKQFVLRGRKETINDLLDLMNDYGQDKAIEQVEMLTKIPEYRKDGE